ncbi:MAG: hydrogenase nickel incorporation protein HypB, partial [Myxococcales bacterium]|nr:hydrogenase nickel incorporation protein HypB [Myxococcales bacterium]
TLAVNLMSSPGAGKTTLLVRTLEELGGGLPLGVIEGDQETSLDAERIRRTGVAALQVNTGRGCHLDASMVARASQGLEVHGGILFIENVGNLVCPAGFDLGEAKRVVIASVTEGEDKPAKYPHMFAGADLVIINKLDLLPYVPIDLDILELGIARVAPEAKILELSAVTGKGFDAWLTWLHDAWAALPRAAE